MAIPVESTNGAAADRVQIELLRAAGTAGRFTRFCSFTSSLIEMSREAIRRRQPELSERGVMLRFVEIHYGRALADRVRRHLELRDR